MNNFGLRGEKLWNNNNSGVFKFWIPEIWCNFVVMDSLNHIFGD